MIRLKNIQKGYSLIIDGTGTLKKGGESVGVGWQYCGNVGKTANSQVAVMACLGNTAVYAEQPVTPGTEVFLAKINPGTDKSSSWGPGLGLVFPDKVIKINLRPGNDEIGFYDGEQENRISGLEAGKPVWLRMELQDNKLLASWSYNKNDWQKAGETALAQKPEQIRVGKMDWSGESPRGGSNPTGALKIRSLQMSVLLPPSRMRITFFFTSSRLR